MWIYRIQNQVLIASPECDLTVVQPFPMSCQPLCDSYFLYTGLVVIDSSLGLSQPADFHWEILHIRKLKAPSSRLNQCRHVPQNMEEFASRALPECSPDHHLKTSAVTCMRRATNFSSTPRKKQQRWPSSQKYFHNQHTGTPFLAVQEGGRVVK